MASGEKYSRRWSRRGARRCWPARCPGRSTTCRRTAGRGWNGWVLPMPDCRPTCRCTRRWRWCCAGCWRNTDKICRRWGCNCGTAGCGRGCTITLRPCWPGWTTRPGTPTRRTISLRRCCARSAAPTWHRPLRPRHRTRNGMMETATPPRTCPPSRCRRRRPPTRRTARRRPPRRFASRLWRRSTRCSPRRTIACWCQRTSRTPQSWHGCGRGWMPRPAACAACSPGSPTSCSAGCWPSNCVAGTLILKKGCWTRRGSIGWWCGRRRRCRSSASATRRSATPSWRC